MGFGFENYVHGTALKEGAFYLLMHRATCTYEVLRHVGGYLVGLNDAEAYADPPPKVSDGVYDVLAEALI